MFDSELGKACRVVSTRSSQIFLEVFLSKQSKKQGQKRDWRCNEYSHQRGLVGNLFSIFSQSGNGVRCIGRLFHQKMIEKTSCLYKNKIVLKPRQKRVSSKTKYG